MSQIFSDPTVEQSGALPKSGRRASHFASESQKWRSNNDRALHQVEPETKPSIRLRFGGFVNFCRTDFKSGRGELAFSFWMPKKRLDCNNVSINLLNWKYRCQCIWVLNLLGDQWTELLELMNFNLKSPKFFFGNSSLKLNMEVYFK